MRKCRERVKSYEEYYEGDDHVEKENKRRKKTGGYNLLRENLVCNFCQKRYLTRISLQVRLGGEISRQKLNIFNDQVHIYTNHRAEKQAKRWV